MNDDQRGRKAVAPGAPMTEPKPTEAEAEGKTEETWGDFVRTLVYALLIALGVRTVAYEPFNIPSESMLPNLLVGDYLFVSKYAYGYSRYSLPWGPPLFRGRIFEKQPVPGDIVVFKTPKDNSTAYIKRLIGLPGDRVQMMQGVLYINDQPVPRERIEDFVVEVSPHDCMKAEYLKFRTVSEDGRQICKYPQYRETLPNGRSYTTLDLDPSSDHDNTPVFVVPPGTYFMMGDNRDASADSRVHIRSNGVSYVPAVNLIGRAEVLFFSTDGHARLWTPWYWFQAIRYDRLFNSLRD